MFTPQTQSPYNLNAGIGLTNTRERLVHFCQDSAAKRFSKLLEYERRLEEFFRTQTALSGIQFCHYNVRKVLVTLTVVTTKNDGAHLTTGDHLRITASALKRWAIAQLQDSLAVGLLWLLGLSILRVPWAPLWALLAATLQIIPHFGPILGLLGPVLAAALRWQDWQHPLYVVILYAVIVVVDGFLLQPYIMRRVAQVPMWASILVPLVLGFAIPFWGFLLAPPLLAVVYAFKARRTGNS